MQCLDNVKLSTRDKEEHTGHENLKDFTVAANQISKKSSIAPALASHRSAHSFGLFLVSGRFSSG